METADLLKSTEQGIHLINVGRVIAIRGSIVDIRFEKNIPPINSVVKTGNNMEINCQFRAPPQNIFHTSSVCKKSR
ncbi:MAG TPA: hypothetical protein VFI29_01540 [Hanamia sp.]|nr:hypothetical protein [Hanamia sp.]